ncbi:MAG: glycosyltransferase involved in cell wall biosis [Gammaproteobacteria bacterium]|nr:glycosyltransferase involved in cell wall biosis [Gammaproteobacteria bacterium]
MTMTDATDTKTSVTVVVPTYREVENIPHLVERLKNVRASAGIDLELLLMDDDSKDGSAQLVDSLALPWVRMVTRLANRGLSYAVLDGLKLSTRDILVVMDADLSHPPEKIPEMLAAIDNGCDIAVGSRFAEGGSTADDWGLFRWLNSRVATLLAFPLTSVSDPMSGFFALRRTTFDGGRDFNPIGYKILLELIIKCRCRLIIDVPIHFDDRRFGESKLSFQEQLRYVQHLRRLYIYKYGTWSHLAQFLLVGVSGLAVNLAVLTLALRMDFSQKSAVALAIVISMFWNFGLNRRFSFSYARDQSIVRQFLGFVAACSVGAVVNYFTTTGLWEMLRYKQLAAIVGVAAGTFFNFAASRFLIFRQKHIRK